ARNVRQTKASSHALQNAGLESSKAKPAKPPDGIGSEGQVTRPAPTSQSAAKRMVMARVEQEGQAAGKTNRKGSMLLDKSKPHAARSVPPSKSEVQTRLVGTFRHLVAIGTST